MKKIIVYNTIKQVESKRIKIDPKSGGTVKREYADIHAEEVRERQIRINQGKNEYKQR